MQHGKELSYNCSHILHVYLRPQTRTRPAITDSFSCRFYLFLFVRLHNQRGGKRRNKWRPNVKSGESSRKIHHFPQLARVAGTKSCQVVSHIKLEVDQPLNEFLPDEIQLLINSLTTPRITAGISENSFYFRSPSVSSVSVNCSPKFAPFLQDARHQDTK